MIGVIILNDRVLISTQNIFILRSLADAKHTVYKYIINSDQIVLFRTTFAKERINNI